MKKYFFYKIVSPTGCVYIGKTINLVKRMSKHRRNYLVPNKNRYTFLEQSFQEHGFSSHTISVIAELISNVEFSDYMEQHYIRLNASYRKWNEKGLNSSTGGDFAKHEKMSLRENYVESDDVRKKRSESAKIMMNDVRKKKNSETMKMSWLLGKFKSKLGSGRKYLSNSDGNLYTLTEISIIENKCDSGIDYHLRKYGHYKNKYSKI